MTLPTNILQSLISRNRQTITTHHELVVFWKSMMTADPECPTINVERDVCVKQVVKLSKNIAKMAAVQKALKRELAEQLAVARDARYMAKLRSNLAARVEKARKDRTGEAC